MSYPAGVPEDPDSSRWAHEDLRLLAWQEGYSAFTVSRSSVAAVRNYVAKQEESITENAPFRKSISTS